MTIFYLRDQVELADGDALVPVAHFSKEVTYFLTLLCTICFTNFDAQVFSTFGSPFLVLMRQVRIVSTLHLLDQFKTIKCHNPPKYQIPIQMLMLVFSG